MQRMIKVIASNSVMKNILENKLEFVAMGAFKYGPNLFYKALLTLSLATLIVAILFISVSKASWTSSTNITCSAAPWKTLVLNRRRAKSVWPYATAWLDKNVANTPKMSADQNDKPFHKIQIWSRKALFRLCHTHFLEQLFLRTVDMLGKTAKLGIIYKI